MFLNIRRFIIMTKREIIKWLKQEKDTALKKLDEEKRKTKEELYKIYGIGEKFIERYSEEFLKILKE